MSYLFNNTVQGGTTNPFGKEVLLVDDDTVQHTSKIDERYLHTRLPTLLHSHSARMKMTLMN